MTQRRWQRLLARALILVALVCGPAAAQEEEPEATPAPVREARPIEPIPLPRVVTASESAGRAARQLASVAAPLASIVAIESQLDEQAAAIDERLQRANALATDPPTLIALREEVKAFELAREQVAGFLVQITERLTSLETALADIEHRRKIWERTRLAARNAEAPEAVLARIRDTERALGDAESRIEARRDELLTLQNRVAGAEQLVAETLDDLTTARDNFRSALLLRDSPPLWNAALADPDEISRDLTETWQTSLRALTNFVGHRSERLGAHLVLLFLALAATITLKRRASAWRADDPRLEASAVVFERPAAAALLITMSLTPLLHPRAPRLVEALVIAITIVPVMRLLPRLLEPAIAPAVYALSALALTDSVRDVIARAVLIERGVLWAETLAAFAFLVWMVQPARLATLTPGERASRWLPPWLRIAAALLAVSALANLFGWMNLARALSDGVLGSAYIALVLYGGSRILRTLIRAGLRSASANRLGLVRHHGLEIADWFRRIIDTVAVLGWFYFTLSAFGVADWTSQRLASALTAEASFGSVSVSLGDLLAFAATLVGALALSRLLRTILEDDVLPRVRTARGVPLAVTSTVHYLILLVGFLLAISAAGVDLNRVSLLAGALGVGIGFGLQNVVNNFVSGLILLYERPVQLGDMVEVGGVIGEVKRIGMRSSTVRTLQGAEVIVPNGNLISDQVVNWTFSDRRRRMEVKVGVAYGTDPERVLDLLRQVARENTGVLADPEPVALFLGFGDSSLDFELRAWTPLFESWWLTQSELNVAVNRAITEAGIEIPFPQRDLHLRTAEPETFGALRREPEDAAG